MNAISTDADELKQEPRGTLDAKTAFMKKTGRFSSINDHITPAGYSVHSGRGEDQPGSWSNASAEKRGLLVKVHSYERGMARIRRREGDIGARSIAAGRTNPSL
jgi:hypothetical protein